MSALIEVDSVSKLFSVRDRRGAKRTLTAVDDVSFTIERGECLGLVGESGSGKSTLGRGILQLDKPTSGAVRYDGVDLTTLSHSARRPYQRAMQIIYQDPYSSLNPRRTALQQVLEPIRVLTDEKDAEQLAIRTLAQVGIDEAHVNRLPRAFSGGQRQRIAIARAIAVQPEFLVCDEPVSALDVSIQAQIADLLRELQAERGLTYLFISHDLSVVRSIATRTAVMYRGRIVELGPVEAIFEDPRHPYTRRLLDAVLVPDPAVARERLRHISAQTAAAIDPATLDAPLVEVQSGHFARIAG